MMAEIALKVEDSPVYKDGDVLCAFNRRRIRCAHAEHVVAPHKAGFNRDGLRPAASLAARALELTRQYKFQRVNRTTVRRTNLRTGSIEELSNRPNANGEYINVPMFIASHVKHERHGIFGIKGREFWYGGKTYTTHTELDLVWAEIENRTPHKEVDFDLWPAGRLDLMQYLFVAVDDDFDDNVAESLVEPELEVDDNGDFVWTWTDENDKTYRYIGSEPPDDGNLWEQPIVSKRRRCVQIDRLGRVGPTVLLAQIRDRTKSVDIRRVQQFRREQIVKTRFRNQLLDSVRRVE
jgi:hypothetical protein